MHLYFIFSCYLYITSALKIIRPTGFKWIAPRERTAGDLELESKIKLGNKKSQSNFYSWRRPNWRVHYEERGPTNSDGANVSALLLLPGFGVGTFYFEAQLEELSRHYKVYSMDFLGQGKSWPISVTEEDSLCYSADLWTEQIIDFVSDIVKERKVHVFGNSLGGFLAVQAAAVRPDMFSSVILANAAPFWAFAPPIDESRKYSIWNFWNGTLPAPEPAFSFGKTYFDIIRSRNSVTAMLKGVYSSSDTFDEKLINDIITSASQPGGYEAFTSILFSPKSKRSFNECLGTLSKAGLACCLIYGKEDPWVVPLWGQRALRVLKKAEKFSPDDPSRESKHIYIEISPSGHAPNHETPVTVNAAIEAWIQGLTREQSTQPTLTRQLIEKACNRQYMEKSGVQTRLTMKDGESSNLFESIVLFADSMKEMWNE